VEETISLDLTDGAGVATFFLDPDVDYTVTASKSGFTTVTKTVRPTTNNEIFNFILGAPDTTSFTSFASGVMYFFTPSNNSVTNATDFRFSFNLTSEIFNVTDCRLTIRNSTTNLNQTNSSFGTGFCNMSLVTDTANHDLIESRAFYQLNGSANMTVSYFYQVGEFNAGNFSLKSLVDDLTNFSDAGFNNFSRFLIAFIVIFAITAFVARTASVFEAEPLLLVVWVLVFIFSFINWLRIDYSGFPERLGPIVIQAILQQYIVFILVTLGIAGYVIKRHTD
jgi:hypothetical protein